MCDCGCDTKDIYLPAAATINKTEMLNATEMYLQVSMDDGPLQYLPGQFVEVSVPGIGEAPISISSSPTQVGGFEMVIRNVGNLTNKIHQLKSGDKLGIRGPFGNGQYPIDEAKGENLVFICGGIGLVPQRSFINYALANRADYGNISVLIGTKDTSQRFFLDELAEWDKRGDINLLETVDVGETSWKGHVGVVTTLIPKIESELTHGRVFICGPPIMYKFVLMSMTEMKVPEDKIFVNLERKMKCGVGKCGHCQINDKYACVDGPVFRYSDLETVPEAI